MTRSVLRFSRCLLQRYRGGHATMNATMNANTGATSALLIDHGSSIMPQLHARLFSAFSCAQRDLLSRVARQEVEPLGTSHSRRHMFIQTQPTPNPSSLMFLPGKQVMEQGSKEFATVREAMASPLATAIFRIEGVVGVFFGSDFVTVKKSEDTEWTVLKPEIYAAIMDHFSASKPLFTDAESEQGGSAIRADDSEIVQMIKELLETRIRPAVAEDGGDVLFVSFEEEIGRVTLKMQGACSGCPSSSVTLKSGIEQMMKHYITEVKEVVEAPADEIEQASQEQFEKLEKHLSP